LTEKKDVYEKVKGEMRLTEKIEAALPGFHGYKEKELRRESDKLIRNHLYLRLSQARSDLKTIFQRMSDRRSFDVLTDLDRLVAKFDRVNEKVNHASYGYAGFFDAVKIEEDDLDRMISYDNDLLDDVESIVSEVQSFKSDVMSQKYDNAKDRVQALTDTVENFEDAFDKRQEVIQGVM
jgi:ABC-type transporter Mla subunit MlaD